MYKNNGREYETTIDSRVVLDELYSVVKGRCLKRLHAYDALGDGR